MDRPRPVSPQNAITLQAGARRARDTSWGASHRRAHDHRSGDEGDLRHALQHDRGDPWALEHRPNPRCYAQSDQREDADQERHQVEYEDEPRFERQEEGAPRAEPMMIAKREVRARTALASGRISTGTSVGSRER
ncbi:MAG: hypothetical protein QOJ06_469 [Pseudonocardiales bacterium]|nr:hypothetical protein [Pseudonocardiales bacterium]